MAGLDHAGVDRADRDLVDLVALDPVELGDADLRADRGRAAPAVLGGWNRTGLSHGWPTGTTPHCSQISRSNRWTSGQLGVIDGNVPPSSVAASSSMPSPSAAITAIASSPDPRGRAEQRRDPAAVAARDQLAERRAVVPRQLADRRGARVAEREDRRGGHGDPPVAAAVSTNAAASCQRAIQPARHVDPEHEHQGEEAERRRDGQHRLAIPARRGLGRCALDDAHHRRAHPHEHDREQRDEQAGLPVMAGRERARAGS